MRLVQALTLADKVKRREFWEEMQLKTEEGGLVERLIFSYKATFHIRGKVNRHNVHIPHAQTAPKWLSKSQGFLWKPATTPLEFINPTQHKPPTRVNIFHTLNLQVAAHKLKDQIKNTETTN
jgi:hypothetical protein